MMNKLLIMLFSLTIILMGCAETTVEKVDETEGNTANDSTKEVAEEAVEEKVVEDEPEFFKVGDTVSVNDVNITITTASFTDPTEYVVAEAGKVLTLELNVDNKNAESIFLDSNEFNLYDSEGNQLSAYYGYDEMAISADLNAGKKAAGKIYYDVPEGSNYELIYTPMFSFDNKEIKWDIAVQ